MKRLEIQIRRLFRWC